MDAPTCPTCGTPLEWSRKLARYLPCHTGPEVTAVIRRASRNRREVAIYFREKQRASRERRRASND